MKGAAGQQRVPEDFVRNFRVSIPPLPHQRAVADYLDRETAVLDASVANKERLLDLLAEKGQALITRAVIRGIHPTAPLYDTRIEWLGEIPAHWRVERARWLFCERDQRSETGEEELLTVSHLTGVTPRSEKEVYMFEAETTEGYKLCLKGDLVINTLWAWMGAMGVSPVNGIVSPSYNVYEPTGQLNPAYVDALVRLPLFAQEVTRHSKGVWSSRLRLYPDSFFEVSLPVPPLAEQREIVSFLAEKSGSLNALKAAAERTIALLKERRAALIAAAITDQIDVAVAA
jgi:type I restriction enzyme S subunit